MIVLGQAIGNGLIGAFPHKEAKRLIDENLDTRLQTLLDKHGQELAEGLVEEVANLNRELAALRRELAALADYQAARDRLLVLETAAASNVRLPRVVVIEPDHLLRPQDGFYGVEYTAGTTPFRWTGPSRQFSFDLFVDRTYGADLQLDALSCIDFEVQKDILLLVDGESVPVVLVPHETGFVATARLTAREGPQSSNLVFILSAVLVPPESTDQRELGIAFGRLTVVARNIESDAQDEEARIAAATLDRSDAEGAQSAASIA